MLRSTNIDAFSDIIRLFHLKVEIYHNARICGHWRINEHELGQTCFHLVTQGSCILDVPGYLNQCLNVGDLVIFPHELPHSMFAKSDTSSGQKHLPYATSQHLSGTGMLCGTATFQHSGSQHLLEALPVIFIIKNNSNNTWLSTLLNMIMQESLQPGCASAAIIDRLSELLFTYALRQYMEENSSHVGLLALYGHERLNYALSAMHASPDKTWTLDSLAQKAMMSRTVFAQSFKRTSGWTVMQYLTWWRMQLAWHQLSLGVRVAEVSLEVGYQSEAAFSRAFQRQFGQTAGQIRRGKKR